MRVEISSIKEMPDMHLMGHTCANLNSELFFIWGGSNENVAYLPIENSDLWIYETLTGYWRHRNCTGECPPYLSSACSALIGQSMFVFGGHSTTQDNWLNSLYCLDLEDFFWTDLGSRAKAEPTKPIRSDKCVSWSFDGKFYVFGGYGWSQTEHILQLLDKQKDLQLIPDYRWPKFGWNNQLVEYNPVDNTWRWPSYSGKSPSARAAHSGALMGDIYYIFGGRDSRERLNDLYALDMKTFQWTQIAVISDLEHSAPRRPIAHLLEATEPEPEDDHVEQEDDDESMELVDAGNEVILEHLTPSPSSSGPAVDQAPSRETNQNYSDDDDSEDPFEYPHPSHLLERWSLSSAAASSSNVLDNLNCYPELQVQTSSAGCLFSESQAQPEQQEEQTHQLAQPTEQQQQQALNLQNDAQANQINRQASTDQEHQPQSAATIPMPTGRSFSSFTPISEQEILLFGGVSSQDKNLDDCWIFNTKLNQWKQIDLKYRKPRLWHTGARTKNNEVVIIGGSNSDKIDEFCTEVVSIAIEPKPLKKLALDTVARSIRMRSITNAQRLPPTIRKLIRLRKQAMALTMRRQQRI